MNFASLRNKMRYGGFFIPFRFQVILLIVALFGAYYWLKKTSVLPETAYTAIIELFITVTLAFMAAVFAISFITAVMPWLLLLFNKRRENILIKVNTVSKQNTFTKKQQVSININPILRPLFGYIRLRLHYDDKNISPKFSLINTRGNQIFSSSFNGIYNWPLTEIKEYKVSSAIIYFEDMFQFFSFAATLPVHDNFYTQPENYSVSELKVQPKKTEDINTRIDQMRKVQGEFLSYKNFENNDDVRRIVWKIYAKNKELVVRVPETNDTYASHVYFYASFYNVMETTIYSDLYVVFLNYFKTSVWNAYHQVSKQNVLIKYIPDQESKKTPAADDPAEKIKYIISTSNWQNQKDVQQYFKKEAASVLCISSLIDAREVEIILDKTGKDLVIIFVQLSKAFNKINITDWLQWVFVKPEKDSIDKLRLAWNFSPLKSKIIANENKIKELLTKSESEVLVV